MKFKIFSFICFLLCGTAALYSQSKSSIRHYNMIRSDDDFTFLSHDSLRADIFDPIKYIALADEKQLYLSIGGEIRHQYQWYQNPEWEGTVDENGHFMQRYMLHADVHMGKRFRVFTQLNSGFSHGRNPAPRRIIDENKFEINQFFLAYKPFVNSKNESSSKLDMSIRFGKMEQKFATARLVATREGQNVRRSFEGLHIRMRKGKWKVDAVAFKEVISLPGVFDDFRDPGETFYGVVAQYKGKEDITFEPSILANHDLTATSFGDSSQQFRISPGFRVFKKGISNLYWNIETALQWGRFSDKNVVAGFAAIDVRYRFPKVLYKPTLGLTFSYSTGDDDTTAGGIGTFEPFFPKAVFGQATVLNPSNLTQYHIELSFHPKRNAKITISHDELFRSSLSDVFYDPCGDPMVPITENLNRARYIGSQTKVEFKQKIGQHYFMVLEYSVFPPGEFLRNMERTDILQYASAKSIIRF